MGHVLFFKCLFYLNLGKLLSKSIYSCSGAAQSLSLILLVCYFYLLNVWIMLLFTAACFILSATGKRGEMFITKVAHINPFEG